MLELLFNKVSLLEIISTQVFSCDICLIFKNTYFEERLRTTTSIFGINSGNKFEDVKANLNCYLPWYMKKGSN